MSKSLLCLLALCSASCGSMKVLKEPPPPPPKSGVTFGGSPIGKFEVQKVGYYCDVKGGILTFSAFAGTEAKATEAAMTNCRNTFKDKPCEFVRCKANK